MNLHSMSSVKAFSQANAAANAASYAAANKQEMEAYKKKCEDSNNAYREYLKE